MTKGFPKLMIPIALREKSVSFYTRWSLFCTIEDSSKYTCNKNKHALRVRSFSFELEGIYAFFFSKTTTDQRNYLNGNFKSHALQIPFAKLRHSCAKPWQTEISYYYYGALK